MLADAEELFTERVRSEQERRELAALSVPARRQALRDLWRAEAPLPEGYRGPSCAEALELSAIEAEVERELAELDDPPHVSPEAEAAWDASYPPRKLPSPT